jgi:hypothetical protein
MISPVRNPVKLPRRAEDTPLYFVRESAAYRADGTQVAANVPRFEPGKFSKAVMVEEGTTNLVSFPWNPVGDSVYQTVTQDEGTIMGQPIFKAVKKTYSSPTISIKSGLTIPNGATFTASIWCNQIQEATASPAYIMFYKGGVGYLAITSYGTSPVGWKRLVVTYTNNTGAELTNVAVCFDACTNAGEITYFAAPQLEQKPYATFFIDGTRSSETLTIPMAGVLNPQEGTVKGFVNLWRAPGTTAQYIFDGAGAVNQNLVVYVGTDGKLRLEYGDGASMITLVGSTVLQKDTWYSVAWRWSSSGVELLLNGNLEASNINLPSLSFGANACLGSKADGTAQLDGLLDNFSVSGRVVPNVEVLEEYRSSMPKYSDEWTTALVM